MAYLEWPDKDPDDVLDYTVDWTDRLETAETLSTSVWAHTPSDGSLTRSNPTILTGDKKSNVWISGGVAGQLYKITNTVTTSGGRTIDQTVLLKVDPS